MPEVVEGPLLAEPVVYKCHCGKKATTRIDSFRSLACLADWFGPSHSRKDKKTWVCCDLHVGEAMAMNAERFDDVDDPNAIVTLVRNL